MKNFSDVYLTPEEVAEKLRLNVETIYRWLRTGRLPGSRISHKAWRVPERELTSFVNSHNVNVLHEHLVRVEAAVQNSKPLLERHAKEYDLQNKRTLMVLCFISQMFEHHEAMLVLVAGGKIGAAFSLARSIFEGVYRGLWINKGASDSEVENFATGDEIKLTMKQLAKANDANYEIGVPQFFQSLKDRAWGALNSYAHIGMMQLARRFSEHEFAPSYTEEQAFEITRTLTTLILILVRSFLAAGDHLIEAEETDALTRTYTGASLI